MAHTATWSRVDCGAWEYDVAGNRGKVDELTAVLVLHPRKHGGDAVQDALDVDVHHLFPLVHLERVERGERHQAGVVDKYVYRAVLLDRTGDQVLDLIPVRHVRYPVGCLTTGILYLRDDPLQVLLSPRAEHHLRPTLRE